MLKNRFLPHPLVSIVFFIFILLYWQSSDIFLRHHDTGWHIAAGQQIRELGYVPEHDSWSFTAGDIVWYNISWLWDIAVSKIYDIAGFAPLLQITVILGGLLCALLAQICLSYGISSLLTLFGVLIVGLIFPFYQPPWDYVLSIAPQAVSLIFFLLFYLILMSVPNGKNLKAIFSLPIFMLLWVNVHGGFIIGFMLIGAAFLASFINKRYVSIKRCLLVGIICAACILINPVGVNIIEAVLRSLNGQGNGSITEWMPFEFSITLASAYVFLFVLVADWKNKNINLFCKIVAFICLVAGILQKRNFVYFSFASLPFLLMSIETWIVNHKKITKRLLDIDSDMKSPKAGLISGILAAFAIIFIAIPYSMQLRFPQGITLPKEFYPQEEIEYLKTRLHGTEPEPIYNHWNLGGHLIFSMKDKVKVYIDGRANTVYSDLLITMPLQETYKNIENNKSVRFSIMPNYQPLSQIYFNSSPKWKKVFSGTVANVYEKTNFAGEAL